MAFAALTTAATFHATSPEGLNPPYLLARLVESAGAAVCVCVLGVGVGGAAAESGATSGCGVGLGRVATQPFGAAGGERRCGSGEEGVVGCSGGAVGGWGGWKGGGLP